jgi:hypothetical protein
MKKSKAVKNYNHNSVLCMEEKLGKNANKHFKAKALNTIRFSSWGVSD